MICLFVPTTILAVIAASSSSSSSSFAAASADGSSSSSSSEFCPTIYADLARRQLDAPFSSSAPFVYSEDVGAKHVPFLTLSEDGKTGTVVVGNGDDDENGGVWHPMVASGDPGTVHYVTHILIKDQDGNVVALESMDPTAGVPATMTFDVPAGVTELTPYEWCNLHGLWAGDAVTVASSAVSDDVPAADCARSHHPRQAWTSVHADFLRRQNSTFESESAFAESAPYGVKHTPYTTFSEITNDGKKAKVATVVVGKIEGGPLHPMVGLDDGEVAGENEKPHWITEIYIVDQDGTIVAMHSLDVGEDVEMATAAFDVPDGAETLQAYAWCNLHGLWGGPVVSTTTVDESSSTSPSSSSSSSSGASSPSAVVARAAALAATVLLLVAINV